MATKATIHNTSDGSSVIAFGDGSFTVASSPEELRSLIPEGIYTYVEKNSSKNAMDLITEHQNLHADAWPFFLLRDFFASLFFNIFFLTTVCDFDSKKPSQIEPKSNLKQWNNYVGTHVEKTV